MTSYDSNKYNKYGIPKAIFENSTANESNGIHYIVFTGPSLSGKTAAAMFLASALHKYKVIRDSFEAPLRTYLTLLFARKGTSFPWDEPLAALLGKTPRDFALREQQHMRFAYGPDVLGRLLRIRAEQSSVHPRFVIADDGTSIQDIRALQNVSLIRVNRERIERIYPFTIPNPNYVLPNRGSIDELQHSTRYIAAKIIEKEGLK